MTQAGHHHYHVDAQTEQAAGETGRLMKLATYAAVGNAVFLVVIKVVAWSLTGSVALLGSLLDSLLDALASLINAVAVRHSLQPRDAQHRFGHGKAEALAGLGQAVIIFVSAGYLIYESVQRLMMPAAVSNTTIGYVVIIVAIASTLALVQFQQFVIKKSGSLAISADHLHYVGDLLMNASVIVALVLSGLLGWTWADPIIGFAIALYLARAAAQIFKKSYDQLMDSEFPNDKRQQIKDIVLKHAKVLDVHDLRTRSAGTWDFIQLHLEMDPQMTLIEAHEISDEVEALLIQEFPRAQIIIHQDPAGLEDMPALDKR